MSAPQFQTVTPAMLADKVRQLTEAGVTDALAIVEVRKLWLEALR